MPYQVTIPELGTIHALLDLQHPETGDFMTYCVWPKDTLTLLPHTDRIAFMQEGKGPQAGTGRPRP